MQVSDNFFLYVLLDINKLRHQYHYSTACVQIRILPLNVTIPEKPRKTSKMQPTRLPPRTSSPRISNYISSSTKEISIVTLTPNTIFTILKCGRRRKNCRFHIFNLFNHMKPYKIIGRIQMRGE